MARAMGERPEDIVRTPGTESNVKEIYDKCAELARDPANEIVNQFSEFGNYLVHWRCTGPALERIFEAVGRARSRAELAGYVSASGSAGTLAAGDYFKDMQAPRLPWSRRWNARRCCMNGYGEHNIQGIGDKHVPLIHNVTNTDLVIGVSDQATDGLNAVFNTPAGGPIWHAGSACRCRGERRHQAFRPILDCQRAGRHQDGQALALGPETGDRHGRHRRP